MRNHTKKSKKPLIDVDIRLQKELAAVDLDEILETVSLKNIPLEERRKEAQKPLFLIRYE